MAYVFVDPSYTWLTVNMTVACVKVKRQGCGTVWYSPIVVVAAAAAAGWCMELVLRCQRSVT